MKCLHTILKAAYNHYLRAHQKLNTDNNGSSLFKRKGSQRHSNIIKNYYFTLKNSY